MAPQGGVAARTESMRSRVRKRTIWILAAIKPRPTIFSDSSSSLAPHPDPRNLGIGDIRQKPHHWSEIGRQIERFQSCEVVRMKCLA
jgi:hypothetical protein